MDLRHGHPSDLPYLYDICHRTGDAGADASATVGDAQLLGHLYAAPYLVRDPHWCWVATDEGTPVGYLLTTPDSRSFAAWAETQWRPALRSLYPLPVPGGLSRFETNLRQRVHRPDPLPAHAEGYPAHLHIDLLPRAQGHRLGSRLIDTFLAQLRTEGVPGVHLGVSRGNEGAIAFYRKVGFQTLSEEPWGLYLGLKP